MQVSYSHVGAHQLHRPQTCRAFAPTKQLNPSPGQNIKLSLTVSLASHNLCRSSGLATGAVNGLPSQRQVCAQVLSPGRAETTQPVEHYTQVAEVIDGVVQRELLSLDSSSNRKLISSESAYSHQRDASSGTGSSAGFSSTALAPAQLMYKARAAVSNLFLPEGYPNTVRHGETHGGSDACRRAS